MNSREKALRFKRLMPCEFDDEDVEDLIKLLDQHAAETIEAYEKKMGVTIPDLIGEKND